MRLVEARQWSVDTIQVFTLNGSVGSKLTRSDASKSDTRGRQRKRGRPDTAALPVRYLTSTEAVRRQTASGTTAPPLAEANLSPRHRVEESRSAALRSSSVVEKIDARPAVALIILVPPRQ
ncbi:hypothetical protein ZIOFF_058713 [Zingiber officinale]|uniref:Uncharacterized protein n=1 Tax=Zingiber officinale TaxID=94328 RepID=A0A8J5KE80_ZINOF|nr:hypothetical protein ZIOFF_058713 [Zingiber officinale]